MYLRLTGLFDRIRAMTDPKDELIAILLASLDDAEAALDRERELAAMTAKLVKLQTVVSAAKNEVTTGELLAPLGPKIENLKPRIEELIKLGKVGEAKESLAIIRGMLGDLGFTVKPTSTPTVTTFLKDTYIKEKQLQDDAHRHVVNYVSLFARITGDRCLSDYRRTEVVDYVRTLERLKSSLGKSPKDEKRSVEELLADSEGKPSMNSTTIEKHVQHVKAFFATANKHLRFANSDDIDNLFDGIGLSKVVPSAQKRKCWSMEQLNALFASPLWQGTKSDLSQRSKRHLPGASVYRDAYWWLPVAALWSGARLEELAQLHHEDLKADCNGVPFIRIHDEGDRRVKTTNSIRNVPLHPFLIELGFSKLFDLTKKGLRIWPELLPAGRLKKLGDTYSTHFTDYRRRCALYEPLRDFHSLRRTFITTMRTRAKIDPLTVAAMVGHDEELPIFERAAQTDDYTDYDIGPLREDIERLDYEAYGLDVDLITGGMGTKNR